MSTKGIRKRSEIPAEFKWHLNDMFATDELWEEEARTTASLIDDISKYEGHISQEPAKLLEFLQKEEAILRHLDRLIVYSNQKSHEDTAVPKYQAYCSKAESIMIKAAGATSFARPEILAMSDETLQSFYEKEPGLLHFKRKIDEILRMKAHTLSPAEENILAKAKEIASAPENIYSMFDNADLKFPYVTDVEGNKIRITHGNFVDFLMEKDRSLRKQVFRSVYDSYKKWGNTLSATYTSCLKNDAFFASTRKYSSPRAMYLAEGDIPESVYDNLIKTVHAHLPALHKYISVRKKLLGVEHMHMYDIFAPVVPDVNISYSYEQAKDIVAKALEPMGEKYVSILKEGMESGWIDVYENENKRSGAYSWGAYGTHPYVLLNYTESLEGIFTLAHEMGHAMHTYFSNENQPYTYSAYLIFVAEVASTCNESLLMHYLLENSTDEKERKFLICHYLDSFRTTLFRQAQFAEFEHIAHEKVASGEAVTQEVLNQLWHDLNVEYYGPDMVVDDEISYEWMRIPHFYTPYYVYQYSTGYSAAVAFSDMILKQGKPAVDTYIENFLCGGCSKSPIELLKSAGVDMSTPKPVDDALNVFERYLDEFEKL